MASLPLLAPFCAAATTYSLEDLLNLPLEDLLEVQVNVASHFVESQLNTGSTVAVINEEQWQKRGARQLMEAIGHLPGTIVLPNWFGAQQIMIRGYADGNNSGGIATLWDDVPISSVEGSPQFNRQFINLGTLDRIEMIRGPGSVLHGENAFHGVFSLHAFESSTDVTRFDADVASNDYHHAAARHSSEIASGIRLNASAGYSGQADQHLAYDYYTPQGSSEREYQYRSSTAVVKLHSDPTHELTWNAGVYWDDIDADGFLSGGTSGTGPGNTGLDAIDVGGVDSDIQILRSGVGYKLDDKTRFDAFLYHWTYARAYTRNTNLTTKLLGTGDAEESGAKIVIKQSELFDNTQWSAAMDLRFQEMGNAHRKTTDIVSGAIFVDEDLPFAGFQRDIRSLSLDANTVLIQGSVHLRYGARIDDYSDFGTQSTPRLGLISNLSSKSVLKWLYGEGFRAPNALEVKGSATIKGSPDIKPEHIATHEFVYMAQTATTLTEWVVFKSRWSDAIVNTPVSGDPYYKSRYINAGDSTAYGVEASFTLQKAPWSVETSASFVHSENTSLNSNYVAFPRWILNLGVGYRLPEYNTELLMSNRAHLDAKEGQITSAFLQPDSLKDYWRSDIHVATRLDKRASVTWDIRNLFDRENYLPSVQANPSPGGIPDEPRSIKFGVTYAL